MTGIAPPRGRRAGPDRPVVVASNRGPVSFARQDDGTLAARRGVGGLVTALSGALRLAGGLWIASAMTEEDREQAAAGRVLIPSPEDDGSVSAVAPDRTAEVRYLAFDPDLYDRFYNGVSNRILWFVHHCLWDLPRSPRFGADTREAWTAYRRVNEAFAGALADQWDQAPGGPAYLVQDYHLALVPAMLRTVRPDARIAFFSHIPFAGPSYLHILPASLREELLAGHLGADVIGFQSGRWAENFLLCCRELPGARVDLPRRVVRWRGREVRVHVYPISVEPGALRSQAGSTGVALRRRRLEEWLAGDRLVLRVDRTELSKNILRGFLAAEELFLRRPEWRGRVRFLALLNPSREAVPEYQAYLRQCLRTARRINEGLRQDGWEPIRVSVRDDFSRVLAAYQLYDVLVVNPVYDGMNLVAKEGPLVNGRDGVLVLSENAGAYEELGPHALGVNPFDVGATAEAMHQALLLSGPERASRAEALREAILSGPLDRWVARQLQDLEGPASKPRRV